MKLGLKMNAGQFDALNYKANSNWNIVYELRQLKSFETDIIYNNVKSINGLWTEMISDLIKYKHIFSSIVRSKQHEFFLYCSLFFIFEQNFS
jgi:hypothetical protein